MGGGRQMSGTRREILVAALVAVAGVVAVVAVAAVYQHFAVPQAQAPSVESCMNHVCSHTVNKKMVII